MSAEERGKKFNQCEFVLTVKDGMAVYCDADAEPGKRYCGDHLNMVTDHFEGSSKRIFPLDARYCWPNDGKGRR